MASRIKDTPSQTDRHKSKNTEEQLVNDTQHLMAGTFLASDKRGLSEGQIQ